MSQINPSFNSSDDLSTLSRKLSALEVELKRNVDRTRRRNGSIAFFGVITVLATAIYVGYAYYRFSNEVTPDLVADNLQAQVQDSMPQVREQLQENLKSNAPKYVGNVLDQLQTIPNQFADNLHEDAQKKLDDAMPQVQQQLYDAMKQTLEESQKTANNAPGATDDQRFQSMLNALSDTYAAQTTKFVKQVHDTYATEAIDFVNYLDRLAQNQGLDQRDQLYRKMFRSMFMLVRARENSKGNEVNTTMFQPAGQQ